VRKVLDSFAGAEVDAEALAIDWCIVE